MEIVLNIDNLDRANHFLRALWAELRTAFGEYAWQRSPRRDGQNKVIYFGYISFRRYSEKYGSMQVYTSYKKRGTIKSIYFNFLFSQAGEILKPNSEFVINLQNAVKLALEKAEKPSRFLAQSSVSSCYRSISPYIGRQFSIKPLTETIFELCLELDAYDEGDAIHEFGRKVNYILDFLAIETNCFFKLQSIDSVLAAKEVSEPLESSGVTEDEFFVSDPDWIDNSPTQNELLIISREGKAFLEFIAGNNVKKPILTFLKACNHFHGALAYEMDNSGFYDREIANVLFISALEVASLVAEEEAPKPCEQCGQPIYSISQRVRALVEKYSPDHVGKIVKDFYSRRSLYLHTGQDLSFTNHLNFGTFRPQLDPDNPTGCQTHFMMSAPAIQLGEVVSFCLRKTLKADLLNCLE